MQKWFFIGLAILGLGLFLMFGTFAAIYTGLDRVLGESDMDDREWIRQAMTIGGIGFYSVLHRTGNIADQADRIGKILDCSPAGHQLYRAWRATIILQPRRSTTCENATTASTPSASASGAGDRGSSSDWRLETILYRSLINHSRNSQDMTYILSARCRDGVALET